MKKFELKELLLDNELENVSGGVKMTTRIATCVLALLPLYLSTRVQAMDSVVSSMTAKKSCETRRLIDALNRDNGMSDEKRRFLECNVGMSHWEDDASKCRWVLDRLKTLPDRNWNVVRACVRNGADVNAMDDKHDNVLFHVLRRESPEFDRGEFYTTYDFDMIVELVARGIDLNAKNHDGLTVLHWLLAFSERAELNSDLFKYLAVEHGADVNIGDSYTGRTALMYAVTLNPHRCFDLVKYLVEKCGADINAKSDAGYTALDYAFDKLRYGGPHFVVEYLRAHGAKIGAEC